MEKYSEKVMESMIEQSITITCSCGDEINAWDSASCELDYMKGESDGKAKSN